MLYTSDAYYLLHVLFMMLTILYPQWQLGNHQKLEFIYFWVINYGRMVESIPRQYKRSSTIS